MAKCRDLVVEAMEEKMLCQWGEPRLEVVGASNSTENDRTSSQITNVHLTRPRKSAAGVIFCVGGRGTSKSP